jgi:hypothetical protein
MMLPDEEREARNRLPLVGFECLNCDFNHFA